MNAEDYREKVSIQGQEQAIFIKDETKIKNCKTFNLNLEDHTVGNLLRIQMLKNRDIKFAGYRVPHPLDTHVEIKVQTTDSSKLTPEDIMCDTAQIIIKDMDLLEKQLDDQLKQYRSNNYLQQLQ